MHHGMSFSMGSAAGMHTMIVLLPHSLLSFSSLAPVIVSEAWCSKVEANSKEHQPT